MPSCGGGPGVGAHQLFWGSTYSAESTAVLGPVLSRPLLHSGQWETSLGNNLFIDRTKQPGVQDQFQSDYLTSKWLKMLLFCESTWCPSSCGWSRISSSIFCIGDPRTPENWYSFISCWKFDHIDAWMISSICLMKNGYTEVTSMEVSLHLIIICYRILHNFSFLLWQTVQYN